MADPVKFSIAKLSNQNYPTWKFEMEMFLEREDLWHVVDEPKPEPETAAWKKADKKARATIALCIDRSQYTLIKDCGSASEVWDALKHYHEKATASSQLALLSRLCDAKLEESGDVEKHLLNMDALFERVEDAGLELAEKLRVAMILRSMPDSYHFLASALEARKDEEVTMELVRFKLIDEYQKRLSRNGGARDDEQGLKVQKVNKQKVCFFCKKPGHFKVDCRKWQAQKQAHQDGGEASGGKPQQFKQQAKAKQAKGQHDPVSFTAQVVDDAVCAGVKLGRSWTIDSGASCHMTGSKDFFKSFEETSSVTVVMADGNCSRSSGNGSGTVTGVDGTGMPKEINLNNVLYVPNLESGLLSVSKIAEKGFQVLFKRNSVEILDEADNVVVLGERSGGVYVLRESEQAAVAEGCHHTLNCQHTWHRRFGHRDPAVFERLKKEDLASGVKIVDCGARIVCEHCLEGKMARLPFPQQSVKKTTRPLQLVHTDLCGPMRNVTPGGNRYFLSIIDDYSRYLWLYLLKNKAEAKGCIMNYVRAVENQFGRKPGIIRSDRGGEFVNKELEDFYRKEGIEAQLTAGYSPQQNGVAERRNRYINDMAVCMLLDANLDKRYWGEAITTAAYIQNRMPSRVVRKTPYELWHGRKPDLSNLRVFGCDAYVRIPDAKRGKLDEKAEKLTFVGYDCRAKAYRFLNRKNRKITVSRDARFLELGSEFQEEPKCKETSKVKQREIPEANPEVIEWLASEEGSDAASLDDQPPFEGFSDVSSSYEGEDPEPNPEPGRGSGVGELLRRMEDFEVGLVKVNHREPKSYQEAVSSVDKGKWMRAMDEEYKSLLSKNTWTLVPLPPGRQPIGSKWVFKQKKDSSGQVVRYKARLVAQGYAQRPGIDFTEVFAPVAMQQTFRVLLTVAGHRKLQVWHIDVKNAYLNGKMDEEQYMRQPPGYTVPGKEKLVCKLNRCLYGLKQAARVWNTTVKQILIKLGFTQSASDACLFSKQLESGDWIYLLIYVDDIIVVCKNNRQFAMLERDLRSELEISSLGEVSHFLGIKVTKDENGFYSISQRAFIREIAERFGLGDAKGSKLPLDIGYYKLQNSGTLADSEQYHSLVGALLYVAMNSRPDIAAAVSILSRKSNCPRECDWLELKRVVRYLLATENYELKLGQQDRDLTLVGFSDADWAGDTTDRKSTSGFAYQLGGATVSWGSRKQCCVSTSTMEAEYIALSEAGQEAVWLRRLLSELGEKQLNPTVVNEDNRSCMDFVSQDRQNKRSKHIDTKYFHAKDLCSSGVIQLKYCPTDSMIADVFTKPLGASKMKQYAEQLGLTRKFKKDEVQ